MNDADKKQLVKLCKFQMNIAAESATFLMGATSIEFKWDLKDDQTSISDLKFGFDPPLKTDGDK